MMPDFNHDGKLDPWEGAAADLWQQSERKRAAAGKGDGKRQAARAHAQHPQRPSRPSGCGCSNVVLGCALIFGFAAVLAIVLGLAFSACAAF